MQYFNTLPKLIVTQQDGTSAIFTNLLSRASLLQDTLNNPLLFYSYDIQDGDTPEIVADKYYGDSYRYWLLLLCNNILDPQWDWPLSGKDFNAYISSKYNDPAAVHHYEKVITQYDSSSKTSTTTKINVDFDDYTLLQESTNTYTFPESITTVSITKNAVSVYDYELELNESKRNIKILRKDYAAQIENNLKDLMA